MGKDQLNLRKGSYIHSKYKSSAFTDVCQMSMEMKQWMSAQWGGGWCASSIDEKLFFNLKIGQTVR